MKYLLDPDGIKIFEAFCFTRALFAFDYDGTLSPIASHPHDAPMRPGTTELLKQLAMRVPVAVISGRAKADVARFLPRDVSYIVGNHGIEGIDYDTDFSFAKATTQCAEWRDILRQILRIDGVEVEDKRFSLAVHYRQAKDPSGAHVGIMDAVATLTPTPRVIPGKLVINIIPAGAPHKGTAVQELLKSSRCAVAVYFGDDRNDEDVFRLRDEKILSVRVGAESETQALFYLKDQGEIDKVLRTSIAAIDRRQAAV